MDFQTLKQVSEQGMGVLAFFVLILASWKVWKFMDLLVNNHLTHIQASLEEVSSHMKDMSRSMSDVSSAIKGLSKK